MYKYNYLFVTQGNYGFGHGWEDLAVADNRREAKARLREYRENEPQYAHRIIQRRELNPQRWLRRDAELGARLSPGTEGN